MRTISSLLYAILLASLVACGSKKDDKDGGGDGKPGPGKPGGTVEVVVQITTPIQVTPTTIQIPPIQGKEESKTEGEFEYACAIKGTTSAETMRYTVEGDKLTSPDGDETLTRVSGNTGELWGEWYVGEKEEKGAKLKLHIVYSQSPQQMTLKLTCIHPKQ